MWQGLKTIPRGVSGRPRFTFGPVVARDNPIFLFIRGFVVNK